MNRLLVRLQGCLLIGLLTGCTTPWHVPGIGPVGPFGPKAPIVAIHDRDLNALLAYYQSMGSKDDQAIIKERNFYRAGLIDGRCDGARMRFGLAQLRAKERGIPIENSDTVMQPCMDNQALRRSNVQYLAHLIQAQLSDPGLEQKQLRDLQALRTENQELRRQVEGLKAIERSLQDRRRRE